VPNTNDISRVIPEIGPLISHDLVNAYEDQLIAEVERATGQKIKKTASFTNPIGKKKRKDMGDL
jgi:hypothetical protein